MAACFVLRPRTRSRHRRNDAGFSCCRISAMTAASSSSNWVLMASKGVRSSQAISMTRDTSAASRARVGFGISHGNHQPGHRFSSPLRHASRRVKWLGETGFRSTLRRSHGRTSNKGIHRRIRIRMRAWVKPCVLAEPDQPCRVGAVRRTRVLARRLWWCADSESSARARAHAHAHAGLTVAHHHQP